MILTIDTLREYGYLWEGMLPINRSTALTLKSQGYQVYLLYSDNTESLVNSVKDITNHAQNGGIFGVEKLKGAKMKQIGNLAIICANRPDILLQIYDGYACIHIGEGPERAYMTAKWDDDETINGFIYELNYGKYASKERLEQNERITEKAA